MEKIKIKSIKKLNEKLDRYDLTVSSTNNFYANGILIHNTSSIIGNIKVKVPRWGGLYEKIFLYLPKFLQFTKEGYDIVKSSRTVIINSNINPNKGQGFGGGLVQKTISDWAEKVGPYLPKDITIYSEIVGYYTGTNTFVQKIGNGFDYGCKPGESSLLIYRVVENLEDGTKKEYNISEVQDFTYSLKGKLMSDGKETDAKHITPLTILYSGTLRDLYPDLDTTNHWHENLLERMKNDKEHFGMEENEPLCKIKVPREGIVIRKNNDVIPEAFKLKCLKFLGKEAEAMDKGETGDAEMMDRY